MQNVKDPCNALERIGVLAFWRSDRSFMVPQSTLTQCNVLSPNGHQPFAFFDRSWFPNPRSCSGLVANAAVVPLMQRPCRFNPITTTITRFNVLLPRYHGNFCLFDTSGSSSASSTSQEIPEDISEFFATFLRFSIDPFRIMVAQWLRNPIITTTTNFSSIT